MEDEYQRMISWAFGDLYFNYNILQARLIWATRHPNLPPLVVYEDNDFISNMKLVIYQITKYWIESKNDYEDRPSLSCMVRGLFSDLFKKKGNIK